MISNKASFTRTVNVTDFVSTTFVLFNVMCKQYYRWCIEPIFKRFKNGDFDVTCKRAFNVKHFAFADLTIEAYFCILFQYLKIQGPYCNMVNWWAESIQTYRHEPTQWLVAEVER